MQLKLTLQMHSNDHCQSEVLAKRLPWTAKATTLNHKLPDTRLPQEQDVAVADEAIEDQINTNAAVISQIEMNKSWLLELVEGKAAHDDVQVLLSRSTRTTQEGQDRSDRRPKRKLSSM